MLLPLLVVLPAILGAAAFAMRSLEWKLRLLVCGAAAHAALTAAAWFVPPPPAPALGLALDPLGLTFLTIASALFLAAAVHSLGYVPRESRAPETTGRYVPSLFLFLAAMTLAAESAHFGLLWVAIEATTLASAPLVSYQRTHGALEAMWKYLLLCSVGIALSLLGTFFLGFAFANRPPDEQSLWLAALLAAAPTADPAWLRAAFLLAAVGYGTKMGLAPLHTWLPDAHSEAPSPVSALLSGALLNCAFLGILRFFQVAVAAGAGALARDVLLVLGLVSLAVAAGSILGQRDYKRLLAYSSVENMGIVAVGIGVGGGASYGALFHAVNHSLAKAMLFLLAGNVLLAYHTKTASEVRGVSRELPATGALLLAGLFAIGGLPPFGLFQSELTILLAALASDRIVVAVAFLALVAIAFVGFAAMLLPMTSGRRTVAEPAAPPESWLLVGPPLLLGAAVLVLGVWVPPGIDGVLRSAAALLGTP
ncbi:MAG: proton-conducting transporter membrane subunit [Candidatus Binatia bacterium]